jgi:hypothetical protein
MGGEERRPRQEGRVVETRRASLPVLMGGTRREEPSRVASTREGTREDGMRGDERRWTRPSRRPSRARKRSELESRDSDRRGQSWPGRNDEDAPVAGRWMHHPPSHFPRSSSPSSSVVVCRRRRRPYCSDIGSHCDPMSRLLPSRATVLARRLKTSILV